MLCIIQPNVKTSRGGGLFKGSCASAANFGEQSGGGPGRAVAPAPGPEARLAPPLRAGGLGGRRRDQPPEQAEAGSPRRSRCRSGTGDGGADGCEPHWPPANSHQACELESTKASAV